MISLLSDVNPEWDLCLAVAVVGFTIIANAYRVWKRTHAPSPPPSPPDSPSELTPALSPMSSHPAEVEESQSSIKDQQNSVKPDKYKDIRERAQAAIDSIPVWAKEDKYLGQSKLKLKPRRQHTDKGHQVINTAVESMLEDVLKELLSRLQVKYTAEDMKKLNTNLRTLFTKPEEKTLRETMVVDLGHKVPDFSRQVFGIFCNILIQSIADYMEDSIKNIHNSSRKRLSKRVNEITELMNQYEVYVDAVARDEWIQIGNRNNQVYSKSEDRKRVYEVMRDMVKGDLKNILGYLTKILGKSKIAYQNDLDISYYWS